MHIYGDIGSIANRTTILSVDGWRRASRVSEKHQRSIKPALARPTADDWYCSWVGGDTCLIAMYSTAKLNASTRIKYHALAFGKQLQFNSPYQECHRYTRLLIKCESNRQWQTCASCCHEAKRDRSSIEWTFDFSIVEGKKWIAASAVWQTRDRDGQTTHHHLQMCIRRYIPVTYVS